MSRQARNRRFKASVVITWVTAAMAFAGIVYAPAAAAQTQNSGLTVAILDLQAIVDNSVGGRQASAALTQFVQEKQAELDVLNGQVDALQAELSEATGLTEQERAAKLAELEALVDQLQAAAAQAQAEINQRSEELRNIVLNDIGQVINLIAQERGLALILDSQSVYYYLTAMDITVEVIRRYDALLLAAQSGAQGNTQAQGGASGQTGAGQQGGTSGQAAQGQQGAAEQGGGQ